MDLPNAERPETLRQYVDKVTSIYKDMLRTDKTFLPTAVMLRSTGQVAVLPLDGKIMESGSAKRILFGALAETARMVGAAAIILITDSWVLEYSAEQERRILDDGDYRQEFERITRDEGVPQAAAAGFGELWESIIITAQTSAWAYVVEQHYKRVGEAIEFGQTRTMDTERGDRVAGRMFTFYQG